MMKKLLILCLFCFCTLYGMGQNMVSGTVVDEYGTGVIGATVLLKGTTKGVMTGPGGLFSIDVDKFPAELAISFLGYVPQNQTVKGPVKDLRIELETEQQALDETVVIAYGTQKKASVVASLSSATAKDIMKAPVGNVGSALTGRLTGLTTMQNSGQPGAEAPTIRIRGKATLNNADPLVIVDGVERSSGGRIQESANADLMKGYMSGWETINPNDIESVTILKDASATAVYGVKGANGVLIITTKKGLSGKATVTYSGSFGLSVPTRLRHNIGSYAYLYYQNEMGYNDGTGATTSFEDLMKYRYHFNDYLYPSMDYADYILKKYSPKTEHNVSVRGGNDFVKYYASVGYYSEDGLVKKKAGYGFNPNNEYRRLSLRTNLDFQFTKRLSASINIDGRFERRQGNNSPGDNQFFWKLYQAKPWSTAGFDADNRYIITGTDPNPTIITMLFAGGNYTRNQVTANTVFSLKYDLDFITKGLSAQGKYSFDSFSDAGYNRVRQYASYRPIELEDGTIYMQKSGNDGPLTSSAVGSQKRRKEYAEVSLNYARSFGDHNVTALAMYNMEKSRYYESSFADVPHAYLGFVGRATYNYKSRYFLDFSIGINGSENFPKGKRFGTFPAVAVGWAISEEPFMESIRKTVSFLKIRGSYGEVGNDRTNSRFLYLPTTFGGLPGGTVYYVGDQSNPQHTTLRPIQEGKAPNYNVTWETAKKYNLGIDAKFFDDRLSFVFDIFKEMRSDILTDMVNYPSFVFPDFQTNAQANGYHTLYLTNKENYAKVRNQGFEVELGWDGTIGKNFSYFVKGSYAYTINKTLQLSESSKDYPYQYATGHMLDEISGLICEGIYDSYEEINNPNNPYNTYNPNPVPGDLKFKDVNGDMKIDDKDNVYFGNSNMPRSTFTASLGFNYKGLDFSMLFQGGAGFYYMPQQENRVHFFEGGAAFGGVEERWTPTGRSKWYPILHTTNNQQTGNFVNSSFWAYDATYLRLKNIELGYNLPQKWMKSIGIDNIRVFLTAQNVWTWTPTHQMKNFDPESIQHRTIFYPLMQIYNVGVSITF